MNLWKNIFYQKKDRIVEYNETWPETNGNLPRIEDLFLFDVRIGLFKIPSKTNGNGGTFNV
jgi:hypothetical protein